MRVFRGCGAVLMWACRGAMPGRCAFVGGAMPACACRGVMPACVCRGAMPRPAGVGACGAPGHVRVRAPGPARRLRERSRESEKRPAIDPPTGRQRGASHIPERIPPTGSGRAFCGSRSSWVVPRYCLSCSSSTCSCGLPGYVPTGGPLKAPRCTCPGPRLPGASPKTLRRTSPKTSLASHSKTREPIEWLP